MLYLCHAHQEHENSQQSAAGQFVPVFAYARVITLTCLNGHLLKTPKADKGRQKVHRPLSLSHRYVDGVCLGGCKKMRHVWRCLFYSRKLLCATQANINIYASWSWRLCLSTAHSTQNRSTVCLSAVQGDCSYRTTTEKRLWLPLRLISIPFPTSLVLGVYIQTPLG